MKTCLKERKRFCNTSFPLSFYAQIVLLGSKDDHYGRKQNCITS